MYDCINNLATKGGYGVKVDAKLLERKVSAVRFRGLPFRMKDSLQNVDG